MATFNKRKNSDGSHSWVAWVRVKPFKPATRGGFSTKKQAIAWAEPLERDLRGKRKAVRADVTTLTIGELAREFLDDPETKSLRTYADLSLLIAWWVNLYGGERVLDFGVLTLRAARTKLQPGRAPATVNRHLSAMRSCWNWARAAGFIPQDRLWPARLMLTEPTGRTRSLSDDELDRVLKAAAEHSDVMHAAIIVSIACGVRQSELLRLKWSDVDLDKQRLRVMLSKNAESRSVYLPTSAVAVLKKLKMAPLVGHYVFIDDAANPVKKMWLEYRWRTIRKAATLHDFRWHDLRHSCASFLAQNGANLLEIGSVLGHKSTAITRRYAHLVEGAPVTGHTRLDHKLGGGGK